MDDVFIFSQAFDDLLSKLESNLEKLKHGELIDEPFILKRERVHRITLDANSGYYREERKHGLGITVKFTLKIISPDAEYNIALYSSTSGGGSWTVRANEPIDGKIETSIYRATQLKLSVQSNAPPYTEVTCDLDYSL